jgi:glycosyltransferase involved in cell wall biosynthesis
MPAQTVSIVIPCYKGERYLAEALESCLRQDYPRLEIIVVDDASPDRCAEIAEAFARRDPRVRVIRRPQNGGVSRAFNTGFEAATGEFLTRLAQDDVFAPTAVAVMAGHLAGHPQVGLVYCDERRVDEEGRVINLKQKPAPAAALTDGNGVGMCVMWRRAVWERTGRFNPDFDAAEDYEYWVRVAEHFSLDKCPGGPQMDMRQHQGMGSRVYSGKQEVLAAKIRASRTGGRLKARRILQQGYFNAAYNYRLQHNSGQAFKHLLAAACCWPFDLKLYRLLVGILLNRR